ncbi:hypothetical protein RFI_40131 [Reticulomyxa filosa]|uniref:NACHT domain-containing protein n=1 Tax=Reticulomyxa filosa TaxID=46433 RepID=X6L7S1_RETFI|nr:hypothetical protein RFI_40131 [Reticulomyxa filosa]|eukprot:ETN97398.1 hypothetical protein RFI_40131 [Reticulomyxa filosa]
MLTRVNFFKDTKQERKEKKVTKEKHKTIELQDIWNDKQNESKVRHISIRGEAGSGKNVLSQRIAYLRGNDQLWNHQFQYLLHIPLRKIINIFYHINDNNNDTNIQLLAFGLMTFNTRIQLSCGDNNTNLDAKLSQLN